MALIDDRGRVFGRVNLIDAAVVVVLLVMFPIGYAAYRLLSAPPPRIIAVEPSTIVQREGDQRVRVKGESLRPFLKANLNNIAARNFLVETPQSGELVVTSLPVGVYDLILSDDVQVVARAAKALTVTTAAAPVVQVVGRLSALKGAPLPVLAPGSTVKIGERSVEVLRREASAERLATILRVGCEIVQGQCAIGSARVGRGKTLALLSPGGERLEFAVDYLRVDADWADVTVRFYGIAEVMSLIKPGDVDRYLESTVSSPALDDVRRGAFIRTVDAPAPDDGRLAFNFQLSLPAAESITNATVSTSLPIQKRTAVVAVPLQGAYDKTPGAPKYRESIIRPGSLLSFETSDYAVRALILGTPPSSTATGAKQGP